MGDNWKFRAVGAADAVTDLLNGENAEVARVAVVGKENQGAQFSVWYVEGDDNEWGLESIVFDKAGTVDTDAVTTVLRKSETAAVSFFGQVDRYYVWWRSDD